MTSLKPRMALNHNIGEITPCKPVDSLTHKILHHHVRDVGSKTSWCAKCSACHMQRPWPDYSLYNLAFWELAAIYGQLLIRSMCLLSGYFTDSKHIF